MSSNDLLSYSIMHKGNKIIPNSLPPLPVRSFPPPGHTVTLEPVVLPPLSNLTKFSNYATVHNLTENNLLNFGIGYHTNSSTPSLTSSSSVSSISTVSSPNLSTINLNESSSISCSPALCTTTQKRRQRLGPSCDSCRSRKVKCNAEISILSKSINNEYELNLKGFNLSNIQINELLANEKPIQIDEDNNYLIISNNKLIKFKNCNSCDMKNISCCFSKGFTKEDIMLNNKKNLSRTSTSPNADDNTSTLILSSPRNIKTCSKIVKKKVSVNQISTLNSRKSSCISCRKRKVKCVYNNLLSKCEGCFKKNHDCLFDNNNTNVVTTTNNESSSN